MGVPWALGVAELGIDGAQRQYAFRSAPARIASAIVILLTVGKVFVIDMGGLTGVFRALSFIGLGLVLVGIGWLYQRLLFPPRPKIVAAPTGAPP